VPELVPRRLVETPGLSFDFQRLRYQPGRWYSRGRLGGFLVGQSERAAAQGLLTRRLMQRHAASPYDCLLQISQIELFALRAVRRALPPIVLYPHTHAAGELRWLRREAGLVTDDDQRRARTARAMMRTRAELQARDMGLAHMVIAPSARFADHLAHDYAYPRDRIAVVPNPIDLQRHRPAGGDGEPVSGVQDILFISRISVRKGVERIVRLSHELADLAGTVRIHVIGDHSAWSDYRPLLRSLNPDTATYHGYIDSGRLAQLYRRAAMVVQPSRFEPFGLTISEALASGIPAVASDEVGAVDGLDRDVCRVFPDGRPDEFTSAVRGLLDQMRDVEERHRLRRLARAEAERLFAPEVSAAALAGAFRSLAAEPPHRSGQFNASRRWH
jgi:glycosyltransferase involved in cell wall biosynthesis